MIGFGICVGSAERFERLCLPGILQCGDAGSPVFKRFSQPSIAVAYNSILVEARQESLDALVLLHDDVRLSDNLLAETLGRLLRNPTVGVVGAVGASNVSSLAWWKGKCEGHVQDTFRTNTFSTGDHEVDTVDGLFMALSPWCVQSISFDESFPGFHGYDGDYCRQVREHGKTVCVTDVGLFHHTRAAYASFDASWYRANLLWQRKWRHPQMSSLDALAWNIRYWSVRPKAALARGAGRLRSHLRRTGSQAIVTRNRESES